MVSTTPSGGPAASDTAPASAGPATGLTAVDLLPQTHERPAVVQRLSAAARGPVTLVEPDPGLIELLRWEDDPAAVLACSETLAGIARRVSWPGGAPPAGAVDNLFVALLERAEQQASEIDYTAALVTLQAAREALPCTTARLTRDQVRALFASEAANRVYVQDKQYPRALQELLAVDPRVSLGPGYPVRVRNLYLEAMRDFDRVRPVAIEAGSPDAELFVDGLAAETLKELWPGRHILQVVTITGSVRTALVTVEAREPARAREPVILGALSDFGRITAERARQGLALAAGRGRLTAGQQAALERHLARRQLEQVIVAVDASSGEGALLRVYRRGGGLVAFVAPEPPPVAPPVQPEVAPEGVEVGVGVHSQYLIGLTDARNAFQVNAFALGPLFHVDIPAGRLSFGIRAAILPILAHSPAEAESEGCQSADPALLAGCLENRAPMFASVGLGYRLEPASRLWITPGLDVQVRYLPNTLYAEEAGVPTRVADLPFVGVNGHVRIVRALKLGRVWARIGLELSAGLSHARLDDGRGTYPLTAVPLGAAATVGATF